MITMQDKTSEFGCTHAPLLDDGPEQRCADGELLDRVVVEEVELLPQGIEHASCQSPLRLICRGLQQHKS